MKTKFILLAILFAILSLPTLSSDKDIKNLLPKMLGATNVGKDFWFTIPPCFEDESGGSPNFIRIFVTCETSTPCNVEVTSSQYLQTQNTIANDVIMFTITPVQGQPYSKGGFDDEVPEQIYPGAGIHVYADQPLVVYCVVRYHYTSDGWMCIPTSSAGPEYIVSGYKVDPMFKTVWGYKLPSTCGIVAPFDSTVVSFTLGGNDSTHTAGGMKPGDTKTFSLNKGDVWMVSTKGDNADLSGSKITANNPVQIVTGEQCANIPTGNQWCDYSAEMDLPTMAWSTDLHVPQITKRKYPSLIRIYAKESNTDIFRDGVQIGHLSSGGGVEGEGFLDTRLVPIDSTPHSAVISGTKPINVMLLNPGTQEDGNSTSSDPFWMAITPMQAYQKEITFCTPGLHGSFGFSENYLALIYQTDSNKLMPDDVEFGTVSGGVVQWSKLSNKFPGVDEVFVPVRGKTFAHKIILLPGDGVYKIRANDAFAAYSYGFSDYDSYGYPAGGIIADLGITDPDPPTPSFSINSSNGTVTGDVKDMPDNGTNRSNLSMINMNAGTSYNYEFKYNPFIPGKARTTTWSLKVINPALNGKAVVTFSDRRGNDTTIIINYTTQNTITMTPQSIDFGIIKVGDFLTKDISISNSSATETITISQIGFKSNQNVFNFESLNFPLKLNPKQTMKLTIKFNGPTQGTFSDSILVTYQSGNQKSLAMVSGKLGLPKLTVSDLDFGDVYANNSNVIKSFDISNTGSMDITVIGYTNTNASIFKTNLPATDNSGIFYSPVILKPAQKLTYSVTFTPLEEKNYLDSISFNTDTYPTDKNYSVLRGTGIKYVSVSWNDKEKPADSYLTISSVADNNNLKYTYKLIDNGSANLEVIDLNGNVIRNCGTVNCSSQEQYGYINISEYSNGIYFLRLNCNGKILAAKFSVVK